MSAEMKPFIRLMSIAVAATLLPAATASASIPPQTENLNALGTASSTESHSAGMMAEANSAELNTDGDLLSVTWSIENGGDEEKSLGWLYGTSYIYTDRYFYGVTITDEDESRRFHPVMDSADDCLCSGNHGVGFKRMINPGEKVAYWSMYSVPENVDSINVEIPGFEPIEDIPIS
ncbi:hypothetical protein [Nocardiopsis nanhaiensis]